MLKPFSSIGKTTKSTTTYQDQTITSYLACDDVTTRHLDRSWNALRKKPSSTVIAGILVYRSQRRLSEVDYYLSKHNYNLL